MIQIYLYIYINCVVLFIIYLIYYIIILIIFVLRCLHTKTVAGLSGGYFVTDIRKNDFIYVCIYIYIYVCVCVCIYVGRYI